MGSLSARRWPRGVRGPPKGEVARCGPSRHHRSQAGRANAEGAADQARAELVSTSQAEVARAQAAHDEAVSSLRAEGALAVESARAELTAVLSARHAADLDAVRARAEGEVAKQTAKAEGRPSWPGPGRGRWSA